MFHTLYPSNLSPVVFALARYMRVGNQSETCSSSREVVLFFSSRGLLTNPTPLIPPSHRDPFHPLRGQLLPPSFTCPPLSGKQVKVIRKLGRKYVDNYVTMWSVLFVNFSKFHNLLIIFKIKILRPFFCSQRQSNNAS